MCCSFQTVLPLLLLLCCTNQILVYAFDQCMFDILMNRPDMPSVAVIKYTPKSGQKSQQTFGVTAKDKNWEPIRIHVSTEDLENKEKYCTTQNEERPSFEGGEVYCTQSDILTIYKKAEITKKIIPLAVQLHSERLLVQRQENSLVLPEFTEESICKAFSVPSNHRTSGIPNADFILYVAAGPGPTFAVPCVVIENIGRPVAAVMNIRPNLINEHRYPVRFAAHLIAHVLGFNSQLMKNLSMISEVDNVRDKPYKVNMVTSKNTKEKSREHFNCNSIDGMELEDRGHLQIMSHWERRNAKDELMSPMVGAGFYTALTLAAFEDMKFYRANYSMAEPMEWGNKAGCGFLKDKCLKDGITEYPNMFCNDTDPQHLYCTSDRLSLGSCGISTSHGSLPTYNTYFGDGNIAGDSSRDFCPVIVPVNFGLCNYEGDYGAAGSRFSKSSWCLDGESLKVFGYWATAENESSAVGGVCAEVLCFDKSVKVRYAGDEDWHDCPEGGYLEPAQTAPDLFVPSSKIKCPKFNEVCTIAPSGKSKVTPIKQKAPELDLAGRESLPSDEMKNKEQSDTATTSQQGSTVSSPPPSSPAPTEENTPTRNAESASTSSSSSASPSPAPESTNKNNDTSVQASGDGSATTFIGVRIGLIAMVSILVMYF